jgi:hypothetical protein
MLFETKPECLYLATYSPFGGVIRPAANVRLGLIYLEGTNTWAYASEVKKTFIRLTPGLLAYPNSMANN